ncbi:MAG: hypothetical protein RMK19_00335 [Bacteroidia bacterium]|nr:hypothetical protein [Bacteroidia bacterium]MDW8014444.1 hypothetical protein [Bacteroidia bacterium]
MKLFFFLLLLGLLMAQEERLTGGAPPAPAQGVFVSGRVIDGRTGEPLIGVRIQIGSKGVLSDEKGAFTLFVERPDTLSAFLFGYRPMKVVLPRSTDNLLLRLYEVETELEVVPVIAEADKETETGAFIERLRSLEIGEIYSQELILKRSGDFYIPNVLRRLPGVSLLGGRYISIRGMGERYNAYAFGAAYPSWISYDASFGEVDHLVSNLLGRIEVRKFWTPELLGHFGGGMVDFQLPSASSDGFQLSYTVEADASIIGRKFARFSPPLRDPIPSDFPSPSAIISSENGGKPLPENFAYGRLFRRYTVPDSIVGLPGGILTLRYDKRLERWRFSLRGAFLRKYLRSNIEFEDGVFTEEEGKWIFEPYLYTLSSCPIHHYTQGGGVSWHIGFQPHAAHSFSIEGLSFLNTAQRNAWEESYYINPAIDSFRPVRTYYPNFFLSRSFMTIIRPTWHFRVPKGWGGGIQIGFIHQAQDIPQAGAMNYVEYPDRDGLVYEQELYEESEVYAQVWSSRVKALQGYIHPFLEKRWNRRGGWLQLRIGGWYSTESQQFRGRQLGYLTDTAGGGPAVLPPQVYEVDYIREVYAPEHIRPGGWYLIERTTDYHRHRGYTTIAAGYGWIRSAWGERWEVLLGSRYESWQRKLWNTPLYSEKETLFTTLRHTALLPAFLLKYWGGGPHTVRGGLNITLIRPPFPTQVPLPYFDYLWAYYWVGDPTLPTGKSYNVDLRYEWLKDRDNLIAIGFFYKYLRDLPEVYLVPASYTLVFTYSTRRRAEGQVGGVEIEMRKVWWGKEESRLWSSLTLTLSESGTEGKLWRKIGRLEGRLQGHSPVVGNVSLIYNWRRWEAALFLNYTGSQIWAMGFDPYVYPHIVEERRVIGEAQISYRFSRRWEVRLAIWDFVNQPYRRTQRVGNANSFVPSRDALPIYERWAYRGYLTIRYMI